MGVLLFSLSCILECNIVAVKGCPLHGKNQFSSCLDFLSRLCKLPCEFSDDPISFAQLIHKIHLSLKDGIFLLEARFVQPAFQFFIFHPEPVIPAGFLLCFCQL